MRRELDFKRHNKRLRKTTETLIKSGKILYAEIQRIALSWDFYKSFLSLTISKIK